MYYFVFCFSVFGVSLDRSYYVPLKFISAVGLLSPRTQQLHSRSGYDSLLNHVWKTNKNSSERGKQTLP